MNLRICSSSFLHKGIQIHADLKLKFKKPIKLLLKYFREMLCARNVSFGLLKRKSIKPFQMASCSTEETEWPLGLLEAKVWLCADILIFFIEIVVIKIETAKVFYSIYWWHQQV